jgi:hypothetical protein
MMCMTTSVHACQVEDGSTCHVGDVEFWVMVNIEFKVTHVIPNGKSWVGPCVECELRCHMSMVSAEKVGEVLTFGQLYVTR